MKPQRTNERKTTLITKQKIFFVMSFCGWGSQQQQQKQKLVLPFDCFENFMKIWCHVIVLTYLSGKETSSGLFHIFLNGPIRHLFVYFRYFLITISIIQIKKSIDGVLGIQTHCRWMVGADNTTELWRPPMIVTYLLWFSNLNGLK